MIAFGQTRRQMIVVTAVPVADISVMVGIAVVFGLLAVFVAQGWLNYQAELSRKVEPKAKPVATRTIVIAAGPMRFGTHVSADNLKEVTWPDEALPAGTFGSIAEVMSGNKRIVLASIDQPCDGRQPMPPPT